MIVFHVCTPDFMNALDQLLINLNFQFGTHISEGEECTQLLQHFYLAIIYKYNSLSPVPTNHIYVSIIYYAHLLIACYWYSQTVCSADDPFASY